jgi:hypothetical protein
MLRRQVLKHLGAAAYAGCNLMGFGRGTSAADDSQTAPSLPRPDGSPPQSSSKLIELGWGTPSPTYIRVHIQEMEQLPFDGLVLDLKSNTGPADTRGHFSWNVWGAKALQASDYSETIDALQQIQFKRFTENFLRFNIAPGNIDWYDEQFRGVLANASLVARLVRQCHLTGLFLDTEQYRGKAFHYPSQPHHQEHSFAEYQMQVRQRGREFIQALTADGAAFTVLLTWGYSYVFQAGKPLDTAHYGLLPAFLDGLLDGATPDTLIYDGWEGAYGYKTEQHFQKAYDIMRYRSLEWTGVQEQFRRNHRASFGIWVDNGKVWDTQDFTRNYFTPAAFEQAVRLALNRTDRYVWIYSEKTRWWDGSMPSPYIEALTKARQPH